MIEYQVYKFGIEYFLFILFYTNGSNIKNKKDIPI